MNIFDGHALLKVLLISGFLLPSNNQVIKCMFRNMVSTAHTDLMKMVSVEILTTLEIIFQVIDMKRLYFRQFVDVLNLFIQS